MKIEERIEAQVEAKTNSVVEILESSGVKVKVDELEQEDQECLEGTIGRSVFVKSPEYAFRINISQNPQQAEPQIKIYGQKPEELRKQADELEQIYSEIK